VVVEPVNPWEFITDRFKIRKNSRISHALDIDQRLLAHTTNGDGVPQNFKGEHLKFRLKFSLCALITLGLVGVNSRVTKLYQASFCEAGVIMNIFYSPWMVDKKQNKSYNVQLNYNLTKRTQHTQISDNVVVELLGQNLRRKGLTTHCKPNFNTILKRHGAVAF